MSTTRDELITRVLRRCGNRAADTALIAIAEDEVLRVQKELEGEPELPWFMLSAPATLATVASQAYSALPSDFLLQSENHDWYITGSDSVEVMLVKDDYRALRNKYLGEPEGTPRYYALDATDRVYWFPTPSAIFTTTYRYYQAQTVLSSNVTNGWLTHAEDWFMGELGVVMAGEHLRDMAAVQLFSSMLARGKERVMHRSIMLNEIGQESYMGDNP